MVRHGVVVGGGIMRVEELVEVCELRVCWIWVGEGSSLGVFARNQRRRARTGDCLYGRESLMSV